MVAKMTPLQFAKKYFELDVFFYDQELSQGPAPAYVPPYGWQNVSADNYRLAIGELFGLGADSTAKVSARTPTRRERGRS